MCNRFLKVERVGSSSDWGQRTILEEGYSRSSTRRATRLAGLERGHRGIMVIHKRARGVLKGSRQLKPYSLGRRGEEDKWEWVGVGVRREEPSRKGKVVWVWSPFKFVLGVRRTTNGVARSMNINITFLPDGRDVPFLREL